MDFGASFNACHFREVMQKYRHYKGKVKLAGDKTLDIIGVGDVSLNTTLGNNLDFKRCEVHPRSEKNIDIGGAPR